ncbi:MAG: hypothetical protein ACRDQD_11480 [Nocardioidaceae bacterium]
MFALSEPGKLDDLMTATGLSIQDDDEIDCPVRFDDPDAAARAFTGAGPMQLATRQSGQQAIAQAVRDALARFTDPGGQVTLPAWYRVVVARTKYAAPEAWPDDGHRVA